MRTERPLEFFIGWEQGIKCGVYGPSQTLLFIPVLVILLSSPSPKLWLPSLASFSLGAFASCTKCLMWLWNFCFSVSSNLGLYSTRCLWVVGLECLVNVRGGHKNTTRSKSRCRATCPSYQYWLRSLVLTLTSSPLSTAIKSVISSDG